MQLVVIAIALAFGVDLLASGLTRVLPIPMQSAVGGLTILGVACILGWWTFRSFSFIQIIEGCIFIDSDLDTLRAVPQYAFLEDVASVLAGGLAASDSLREHWQSGVKLIENEKTEYPWLRAEALALVTDAIEVVLFDYLSMSLSQTLKRYGGDRRHIHSVAPSAFPGMALGNVFMAADSHTKELRLVLPAGSGLIRPASNVLVLFSPRFRLRIKIDSQRSGCPAAREGSSGKSCGVTSRQSPRRGYLCSMQRTAISTTSDAPLGALSLAGDFLG